jgi:hypothetical protein
MGKNTAVVGGLLSGIGKSMVDDAEQKRQDALAEAAARRASREKTEDREYQGGLLSKTVQDEKGGIHGVTRAGKTIDLGLTGPPPKGSKGSGKGAAGYISPEDKRLIDTVIKRHTVKGMSGEQTDWDGVAHTLTQQGRNDLAGLYAPNPGEANKIDIKSPEYREAQRLADEWIDEQAGWGSTDETDFESTGGNREQARQDKTMEFYQQLTGKGAAPAAVADGGGSASKSKVGRPNPKPPKSGGDYKSADDVKAAMRAGKITREQALSVLRSDFGFQ